MEAENNFKISEADPLGRDPVSFFYFRGLQQIHKLVFFPSFLETYIKNNIIDLNVFTNDNNVTPAMIACIFNKPESLSILQHYNCDINIKDSYGYTALMYACMKNNIECVKILLTNPELDINSQDIYGYTALIDCHNNPELTTLLLSHPKIDVNIQNCYGYTAIMKAAQNKNHNVVDLLLKTRGINLHHESVYHETFFTLISEEYKIKIFNGYLELLRLRELDLGSLLYYSGKKYI